MNTKMTGLVLSLMLPTVFLMGVATNSYSADYVETGTQNSDDEVTLLEDLKKYLYNLGGEIGYDLNNTVTAPSSTLFNSDTVDSATLIAAPNALKAAEILAISSMFAALPVNTSLVNQALKNFYPTSTNESSNSSINGSNRAYTILNKFANISFPSYNEPSSTNTLSTSRGSATATATTLAVNPLVDQQTYQTDPVTQSILNSLLTPNYTFCMNRGATTWQGATPSECGYLYKNRVLSGVVGTTPPSDVLYSYDYQQNVLSQLNSNSLLGPLLYDTSNTTGETSSRTSTTDAPSSGSYDGLASTTQAEDAANFIRYATSQVLPYSSMTRDRYDQAYSLAITPPATGDDAARTQQETAQSTLNTYIASMRVYAAQNSVATSNLYYILSKRLPIAGLNTSQAMSEMEMATRRLYNPAKGDPATTPQWVDMINSASSATVQKEMAILLSEINYQLYLSRQQQERILLTNSLQLIQALTSNPPLNDGSTDDTATEDKTIGAAPITQTPEGVE